MSAPSIRIARHEDLPRIVEIYNASVPGRLATADLKPVSVESREFWFSAHDPAKHPLTVAVVENGAIAGWGSLNAFYGRIAYQHTVEISIYVAPEFSRRGIGGLLTDDMLKRCPALKIKTVLAYIFAHNEPSVQLFKKRGFVLWGHLPRIADMDGIERDLDIYGLRIT